VFRTHKIAIFIDGCFWHGCPKHFNMPVNNQEFWFEKLSGNKRRDKLVTRALKQQGWRVLRIWEHELATTPERTIARLADLIRFPADDGQTSSFMAGKSIRAAK
jgi:DNA mismatch endonuclease (patch repair protein)